MLTAGVDISGSDFPEPAFVADAMTEEAKTKGQIEAEISEAITPVMFCWARRSGPAVSMYSQGMAANTRPSFPGKRRYVQTSWPRQNISCLSDTAAHGGKHPDAGCQFHRARGRSVPGDKAMFFTLLDDVPVRNNPVTTAQVVIDSQALGLPIQETGWDTENNIASSSNDCTIQPLNHINMVG